jgi:hypothetical protein
MMSEARRPSSTRVRRWLANLVWTILGIALYAMCINVFGGYPRYHTEVLTWAGVCVFILLGIGVWVWFQRHDDES